jgi:hypothetical protein
MADGSPTDDPMPPALAVTDVTDLPDPETNAARVAAERDELVTRVRDHAGRMARDLARLQGGDYGRESFSTDDGTWTLKHEAGEVEFLRFQGTRTDVYVVSTKQAPDPEALSTALADYGAFVAAWDEYVASFEGLLDEVPSEFPTPASTEGVVAERDRIAAVIRATADRMAGELHRYEGSDYGSFTARVDGTRWELKRELDRVSYLRVGGEGGTYLLSQYGSPSAEDLREFAGEFEGFVAAFDDHARELEAELKGVDVSEL